MFESSGCLDGWIQLSRVLLKRFSAGCLDCAYTCAQRLRLRAFQAALLLMWPPPPTLHAASSAVTSHACRDLHACCDLPCHLPCQPCRVGRVGREGCACAPPTPKPCADFASKRGSVGRVGCKGCACAPQRLSTARTW